MLEHKKTMFYLSCLAAVYNRESERAKKRQKATERSLFEGGKYKTALAELVTCTCIFETQ